MDREETGVGEGEEDEVQRKTPGGGAPHQRHSTGPGTETKSLGRQTPRQTCFPLPLSNAELPHWSLPATSTIPPWHRSLSVSLPLSPMLAASTHSETTLAMPHSSSLARCLPQL